MCGATIRGTTFLILRSIAQRCVSKDEATSFIFRSYQYIVASWFETALTRLLTMRGRAIAYGWDFENRTEAVTLRCEPRSGDPSRLAPWRVFNALWLRRTGTVPHLESGTAPDQQSGVKIAAPHPGHKRTRSLSPGQRDDVLFAGLSPHGEERRSRVSNHEADRRA
jgi:hypothetical protein